MSDPKYTERELLFVRKISELNADRNEWKRQHENLLAVKEQDNAALNATIDLLRARVAELERPGWVMVPSEPTPQMVYAGLDSFRWNKMERMANDVWAAMLAAAPAQTQKGGEG